VAEAPPIDNTWSKEESMFKIVPLIALLMLALATAAYGEVPADTNFAAPDIQAATTAQDFRSPDGSSAGWQSAPLVQDLRSPDAAAAGAFTPAQDLRSPDGGSAGNFSAAPAPVAAPGDDSFAWGYLAALIATALIGLSWLMLMLHRRREHRLATGH
jgi:hypothetical protein